MGVLDDLDKPNLKEADLFHFLHYEEGLTSVSRRSVHYAVIRRQIVPTRIGNTNYFSKRDGLNWIASSRLPEVDYTKHPDKAKRRPRAEAKATSQ